jgi:hypothetical protein
VRILDVGPENVGELGFFCYMSKRKSEGYARKLSWLERRFDEGLRIKMLELPDRGFIEYIPGEYAWRTVDARGFFFIHCLWVVGKSKGNGFAEVRRISPSPYGTFGLVLDGELLGYHLHTEKALLEALQSR